MNEKPLIATAISQLVHMIRHKILGTSIVSVTYKQESVDFLKKTGATRKDKNPYYGAVKICSMTGMIGANYQNKLNKLADAGEIEPRLAKKRKWGYTTKDRLFVVHRGAYYLNMILNEGSYPDVHYFFEGKEISKETLAPYFKKKDKQDILVRNNKLQKVLEISSVGKRFAPVADEAEKVQATQEEAELVAEFAEHEKAVDTPAEVC